MKRGDQMPVIRVNKTKDFTVMSNYHFREKQMSLKAKGLLSLMLSLPDDWDYSIAGLVTLSKDGKDSVMNTLNELERFGYLKRTRVNEKNGQFAGYDYDIFETPIKEKPNTEKPAAEKPYSENPHTENPYSENPPQLNTNKLNTNKLNTNNINNIEIYKNIILYLNEKAGTKFKPSTKATQTLIKARLNENFTIDHFKSVIDKKSNDWLNTEFEQYLRPQTLFGTKFESYLNAPAKANTKNKNQIEAVKNTDEELKKIFL